MNTDVMFSSKTDLWETPQKFFDELDLEFHFDLDVCALPENAKCEDYYTPETDGLSQCWHGCCWCNPPYGREIERWVKKAADSAAGGGNGGYVASSADRYTVVSRLHIRKGGGSVCTRTPEVRRE